MSVNSCAMIVVTSLLKMNWIRRWSNLKKLLVTDRGKLQPFNQVIA